MPSLLGAISLLNEVGLDKATLDKAVAESAEVRAGVIAKTQEALAYWQSIAPTGTGRDHVIFGREENEPGDYKASLQMSFKDTPEGLEGKVGSPLIVARLLEYGTAKMQERGYAQKTIDACSDSFARLERS